MLKIRKGDQVIVNTGKDKGKHGNVEKVLIRTREVIVSGVNMYKKHQKARGKETKGGIIDIIKPLSVSRITLICPKCKKGTRVSFKMEGEQKYRVCAKCKEVISVD